MGIIDSSRADLQRFINGEGELITFITPGGSITKTIKGFPIKHSIGIDQYGVPVQAKTARVNFSEEVLVATGYPVRTNQNIVSLEGHFVKWADSSGTLYTYVIGKIYPSRTFGNIVCELKDFFGTGDPKKIIGSMSAPIHLTIVDVVDPTDTQTLDNGDIIPAQYVLNDDGTLTIPYIIGMVVLTPFLLDEGEIQDEPYDKATGTFNNSAQGGFIVGNRIAFNANIPQYLV